eukprot:6464849-Amphidinium_carterae.3
MVEMAIQIESVEFWRDKMNLYIHDLPAHLLVEKALDDALAEVMPEESGILCEATLQALDTIMKKLPYWREGIRPVSCKKLESRIESMLLAVVAEGKGGAGTHNDKLLTLLHSASIALPMSQRVSDEHQQLASQKVQDEQATHVEQLEIALLEVPVQTPQGLLEQLQKLIHVGMLIHADCKSTLQPERLSPWINTILSLVAKVGTAPSDSVPQAFGEFLTMLGQKTQQDKYNILATCLHLVSSLQTETNSAKAEGTTELQAVAQLQLSRVSSMKLQQQIQKLDKVLSDEEKTTWATTCSDILQRFQTSLTETTQQRSTRSEVSLNKHSALLARFTSKMKAWQQAKSCKTLLDVIKLCKQTILQANPQEHEKALAALQEASWGTKTQQQTQHSCFQV